MENIAIIITKLNGGGAERCASNLSIELSKKYNVFLMVFDCSNITYPYKGKLIDLNVKSTENFVLRFINVFRRAHKVRKLKKHFNIKCSISLLDGPNIVNVMSKVEEKTIVSIRNRLSSENVNKFRRKMIQYTSNKADRTVCLSKMVLKDMEEEFGIPRQKLCVIYNHVDSELLHSLSNDCDKPRFISEKNSYIVTMGRLNQQKGQWHLIRAFKEVTNVIPNIRLVIIGEGDLKEKLEDLAKRLKIDDKVIFTGYIKNPHNILRYSEMFVFPSLFEGLGNVLLEALAFNLPIVSTDCIAGPREILSPKSDLNTIISEVEYAEYGVLTPVCDKEHFDSYSELTHEEKCMANAIIRLHEDDDMRTRYKQKACERVKDFDKEIILKQWSKIIYNK